MNKINFIYFFIYWFWIIMFLFIFIKHPLIMGLMLMLSTFFLCVFISLYSFSSWNSYILFLMFLGGILILFLYNISLISIEMFSSFNKNLLVFLSLLICLFLMWFKQGISNDMLNFFYVKELMPMIFFLYYYNLNTIIFLVSYLFLSLICIVNLIYLMKDKGSMRSK